MPWLSGTAPQGWLLHCGYKGRPWTSIWDSSEGWSPGGPVGCSLTSPSVQPPPSHLPPPAASTTAHRAPSLTSLMSCSRCPGQEAQQTGLADELGGGEGQRSSRTSHCWSSGAGHWRCGGSVLALRTDMYPIFPHVPPSLGLHLSTFPPCSSFSDSTLFLKALTPSQALSGIPSVF